MNTLWRNARLVTLAGGEAWGWIERGALVTAGGTIQWIGNETAIPHDVSIGREVDLGGQLVTPGLVDSHTHLVYAGDRAREFELRLQGATYEEIARAGGGIRSTVAATRAATEASLFASARTRALDLMAEGVTTVEVKSGYGLSADHEARCLRVARRLGNELPMSVRTTCLSAHALPLEFEGQPDRYIEEVCAWLPVLHAQGLVDAVDAFCESIAFTPAQTRRVFETAKQLGLPVKLHAEQLSDQGGAALAAGFGALSCDHLEHLSDEGIAAMSRVGSVAILLPGAFHFLRETRLPPIQKLREAGVPIAVATDHNPGSSPTLSPLLMMNMACTLFRLTPEEALRGFTQNAARALGLADRGVLAVGKRADLAIWALDHPAELSYWFGRPAKVRSVFAGEERAS